MKSAGKKATKRKPPGKEQESRNQRNNEKEATKRVPKEEAKEVPAKSRKSED